MTLDVVDVSKQLIAIQSESWQSNVEVSDSIEQLLRQIGFDVERVVYHDENEMEKVSLVGKIGSGTGGFGLFGHSDTVPGGEGWSPTTPEVRDGKLIGRGACDMKGPVAAMIVAASRIDATRLQHPLFIAVTADEEQGHVGAYDIAERSEILAEGWPAYSVVGEPSEMVPVYAHKGGYRVDVTAHGVSAHTSTDLGTSANFLIAPFLAEMAELVNVFKSEERFKNHEFSPPTNGFNMILNDGGTKSNVTAAKTVCTLSVRAMPNAATEDAVQMIVERAKAHDLEVTYRGIEAFYVDRNAFAVQAACRASGHTAPISVPYGTEASQYQHHTEALVMGPGNIAQAHTVGEWVEIAQLEQAVEVYGRMIEELCT